MSPLVIETYLDLRSLRDQQSVVLVDSTGKQWPVSRGPRSSEVVLERWVLEIDADRPTDKWVEAPVVYKEVVVAFRSLFTHSRLLPAWSLRKRLSKAKITASPIQIKCRILDGSKPIYSKGRIGLTRKIIESEEIHNETFRFNDIETPAGALRISVSYKTSTDFRVSDSEALLSTHFLSMDESKQQNSESPASVGSHGGSAQMPIGVHNIRDRRRSSVLSIESTPGEGGSGRPAVPFQPFKAGSLGGSPSDQQARNSSGPLAALRIPGNRKASTTSVGSGGSYTRPYGTQYSVADHAISSSASSGSSFPRYSSSFGSRGQWQRTGSVGSRRQSISGSGDSTSSSPLEPGSGLFVASNDIGDFVKMVDSVRRPSGGSPGPGLLESVHDLSASRVRTSAALSRFQHMRSSHNALTESLQTSVYNAGPVSQGAAPSAAPGSAASSPATRGPHTPVVPSRLSTEFTAERPRQDVQPRKSSLRSEVSVEFPSHDERYDDSALGTSPLDIPRPSEGQRNSRTASSLSDRRTSRYEEMHALPDIAAHHQSIGREGVRPRPAGNPAISSRNRLSFYMHDSDDRREQSQAPRSSAGNPQSQSFDDDDLLFAMSDMHISGQ